MINNFLTINVIGQENRINKRYKILRIVRSYHNGRTKKTLLRYATGSYNSAKNYKRSYLQAMGAIFSFFSVLKIKRNDLYQGFLNKQYDIKGFTNEVHFERIKISDSIFATTIQKILTMNLSLKTETRKENYIGPDYELFDLNLLVTSNRENFMFIEQFQFIEQFDFKDS